MVDIIGQNRKTKNNCGLNRKISKQLFYQCTAQAERRREKKKEEKMAFLLKNCSSSISSHFRSKSQKTQDALSISRRGFHVEPGPREKALLAADPALKWFKSHKKSVWRLKRAGDVLTVLVVAGCCYEIYVKAVMREEARKEAKKSAK